jgi:sulfur carrier protein
MEVVLNGETRNVAADTVSALIAEFGLENKLLVVEIDGAIIPKEQWAATRIGEGMKIELVHFVGGG